MDFSRISPYSSSISYNYWFEKAAIFCFDTGRNGIFMSEDIESISLQEWQRRGLGSIFFGC